MLPITSPLPPPSFSPQSSQKALRESSSEHRKAPVNPGSGINRSGVEGLVPRRLPVDQNVLSLPLTRLQRSIYLLVDGHRTIADLARCTNRNTADVGRLLSELQEHGLIFF
jgi:hypothetical protein